MDTPTQCNRAFTSVLHWGAALIPLLVGALCGFYLLFFGTFLPAWLVVVSCLTYVGWDLEPATCNVATGCLGMGTAAFWTVVICTCTRLWRHSVYLTATLCGALAGVGLGGLIYMVSFLLSLSS
jgi:hypothetical protein